MDREEYEHGLKLLEMAAKIIYAARPGDMLKALSKAETLAPVVDPTLYKASMDGAADLRKLLEAARPLERLVQEANQEAA